MPRGWDVPVRVVGLHSWVWLVFATETELLQRGKHQGEREAVIPVLTPGGAAASLCRLLNMRRLVFGSRQSRLIRFLCGGGKRLRNHSEQVE